MVKMQLELISSCSYSDLAERLLIAARAGKMLEHSDCIGVGVDYGILLEDPESEFIYWQNSLTSRELQSAFANLLEGAS